MEAGGKERGMDGIIKCGDSNSQVSAALSESSICLWKSEKRMMTI